MDVAPDPSSRHASASPPPAPADDGHGCGPGEVRGLYAGLSREMCNPLISLRAGFDLLLAGCEGPISDRQRSHVRALRAQCDDMLSLTRTYLQYAGLAGEARTPDLATFRLGALLREADRQLAESARSRGIAWSCALGGCEDTRVVTDLWSFQRIVGHLVANAVANTPEGGKVSVRCGVEGDEWTLEVSDDGRGIPAGVVDRVFEPLVRIHAPSAGPGPGPGLGGHGHGMGLAVCRELVGQLGGTIALRSEPGLGTSVTVRFPTGQAGTVCGQGPP